MGGKVSIWALSLHSNRL